MIEGIAGHTGMERGARRRPADDRVPESAIRDNGIARAAAQAVGIAVTPPFAYGMAVARTGAQNIAMTRAGANRIARASAGAHDVGRTQSRDNQGARLIVIENEGLAAGVEADAAAGGRVSSTGRTRHLNEEDWNGRRRWGQRTLQCRDGHLSEPDQGSGERREYGRVLNVGSGHTGRLRRRMESVAHAAAETAGHARTARAKRAAYPESHANSVSTPRREAHRIAAPAAAAKSGASDTFVKRITRTAPATDAMERTKRPGTGLTSSRTGPGDLIADRGRVARARTPTPGRAEACPSITMTRATPNGGPRTAESAAVASAGAGGTTLMTSHLDGEAVTAAGTDRASGASATAASIAVPGTGATGIARTRTDATGSTGTGLHENTGAEGSRDQREPRGAHGAERHALRTQDRREHDERPVNRDRRATKPLEIPHRPPPQESGNASRSNVPIRRRRSCRRNPGTEYRRKPARRLARTWARV